MKEEEAKKDKDIRSKKQKIQHIKEGKRIPRILVMRNFRMTAGQQA